MGGRIADGLPADQVGAAGQTVRGVVTGDQRARIQREIAATMAGLIADCRRGPNGFDPTSRPAAPTVTVSGAPVVKSGGNGWREGVPLHSHADSTTNALVDGLALAMQPHGPQNLAQPKPKAKE
jgi:hypothetical protein